MRARLSYPCQARCLEPRQGGRDDPRHGCRHLSRVRNPATLDRYAMCRAPVAQSDRARDF
jgi:hypothetical protein